MTKPRISIVTNGNFFSAIALRQVFESLGSDCEWQVIVTTGLRRQAGNRYLEAVRLVRRWGPRYTVYKLATVVVPRVLERFGSLRLSVPEVARHHGLTVARVRNVNAPEHTRQLEQFSPDILLSYSCPYRIRPHVLSIPRIGSLNVHSSLLPAYAGVCTYVHVLANGEAETGVTVHEMVEAFDAGRILEQRRVQITPRLSVFRLFTTLSVEAGRAVSEALAKVIAEGKIYGEPQDLSRRTYFGEPSSRDIIALRRHGHRLMVWSDLAHGLRAVRGSNIPQMFGPMR